MHMYETVVTFTMPTQVYYGVGCAARVGDEAKRLGGRKILLVTDEIIQQAGCLRDIISSLEQNGLQYSIFNQVPVDPTVETVAAGTRVLQNEDCDLVVMVGGGSVLCAGKGIAIVATNGGSIRDYEGTEKFRNQPLPMIAVPTTAGSGSEVSPNFNITDAERNYKMTIRGRGVYPQVALLDPLLLTTLPPWQALVSGMDALTHAVEATWTVEANALTDCIAFEAIKLILENMAVAAFTRDLEAKGKMLLASTMANIACGNAKLGLVHALAQPLASYHVAHGLANGILLPYVMEYNLPVWEDKLVQITVRLDEAHRGLTRTELIERGLRAFYRLYELVGFPDRLPQEKVTEEEIPRMVQQAKTRPQWRYNIRRATDDDLARIYKRAFIGWRSN